MRRVFAFIDESGAFGWDLANPSVSTCFVVSAIIVEEAYIDQLQKGVEKIRKKYFQKGEMKSSRVGQNHKRRMAIIHELLPLPFTFYTAVFDKAKYLDSTGLRFRDSFYKFLNNIVHRELKRNYPYLTIVTDEIGTGSYMLSFSKYVQKRTDIPSLLGEMKFSFENSTNNILIQLADFVAGTYACEFNMNKRTLSTPAYSNILSVKKPFLEHYPLSYQSYLIDDTNVADDEDVEVAQICYKRSIDFISEYEKSTDRLRNRQIIVLKYLLQQFMYAEKRTYIPAYELIQHLHISGFAEIQNRLLQSSVIGPLRDSGVIISGSSKKGGYKIPSKYQELVDYVNHDVAIILPMLFRLKKCRNIIRMGTMNKQDLFESPSNEALRKLFNLCEEL